MTWQPTDAQVVAKLDPDIDRDHEAKARVVAAITLLGHWLESRDPVLLAAADDMVQIAQWWSEE